VRQFFVIGRGLPSEKNPNPTLYRMRVFAVNPVLAKSKFWYHMKRQHKVRKVQGEIVSVQEIYEKKAGAIKNYGIVLRYLSRTETINMYKEFRDTTLSGAVSQMCKSPSLFIKRRFSASVGGSFATGNLTHRV
jgi:large subunit ribosomal protein L18Ae